MAKKNIGYLSVFNWKGTYRWKVVGPDGTILARSPRGWTTFREANFAASTFIRLVAQIASHR